MARNTIQLATVIVTVSTIPDGAKIERQWFQKSVWLSERFIMRLLVVLLAVELVHRVLSGIRVDLSATYYHHKYNLKYAPQWITVFFIWRLFNNAIA